MFVPDAAGGAGSRRAKLIGILHSVTKSDNFSVVASSRNTEELDE